VRNRIAYILDTVGIVLAGIIAAPWLAVADWIRGIDG
jgi:hypothetical protein